MKRGNVSTGNRVSHISVPEPYFRRDSCALRAMAHNWDMNNTSGSSYTAKLTDGPLEGKTISIDFLPSGDVKPSIEVPVDEGKAYLYVMTGDSEYEEENSDRPTAVGYRYRTTSYS